MAVSIDQAATNAFVTYLTTKLPDVKVSGRWPGQTFPGKAITVIPAGSRKDTAVDPRVLSKVNVGSTQTDAVWQVAACVQPYQLDVWATSYLDRDDIKARLDEHLRAGYGSLSPTPANRDPFGNGCCIAVTNGWEAFQTSAKFTFEDPDYTDTPDSISRSQFRLTYRGQATMMLALRKTTARQKVLKLSLLLDGVLPRQEYTA